MASGSKKDVVPTATEDSSSDEEEDSVYVDSEVVSPERLVVDAGPQLSRGAVFQAVMEGAMGANKEPPKKSAKKESRCTPLLTDSIATGVDALTFMGNIFVECKKRDGSKHVRSQLVMVAGPLSVLCFFTIKAMVENWEDVQECRHPRGWGEKDEPADDETGDYVNPFITLAFALVGGLGLDVMCIVEFYKSNQRSGSAKQMNMFAAFLHVGADGLRAFSTLVMSIIIIFSDIDSYCVDAYTSTIIGITIILGAFFGFFKWVKMLVQYLCNMEVME